MVASHRPGRWVIFVTSNPDKLREVRQILAPSGISVRWSRRTLPEPQADTLDEVVRAKLRSIARSPHPVLVEDSGIFLDDLGGFPGVYSKYVYDTIGLSGILRLLKGRRRSATFRTVAGVRDGTRIALFEGATSGRIAPRPIGEGGFGYDPIFVPQGARRTFAEMDGPMKNRLSHRGKALRAAAASIVR